MADQYKKPYLESSVFIAWIKGESIPQKDAAGNVIGYEERAAIAKHILSLAEAQQFHVHTSSITITEVHKGNPNVGQVAEIESKIIDFFRHRYFRIIDVDRSIAESAHRLCLKHGLRPYDAVHLACAIRAGCDALLTWDSDLLKIEDGGIEISKPRALGQLVLDLTFQRKEFPQSSHSLIPCLRQGPRSQPAALTAGHRESSKKSRSLPKRKQLPFNHRHQPARPLSN